MANASPLSRLVNSWEWVHTDGPDAATTSFPAAFAIENDNTYRTLISIPMPFQHANSKLLINLSAMIYIYANSTTTLQIFVDGVLYGVNTNGGVSENYYDYSRLIVVKNMSAGLHTLTVKWKCTGAVAPSEVYYDPEDRSFATLTAQEIRK